MSLSSSVDKTFRYGKFFGYYRNLKELHFWLISTKIVSILKVKKFAPQISNDQKKQKIKRFLISKEKHFLAKKILLPLRKIPFVVFIGITGSVAAKNAKITDDIDIIVITHPNTLWLTRPLVLVYLSLLKVRRKQSTPINMTKNLICPNLWIDTDNLKMSKSRQNLYTAHEILQIKKIFDKYNTFQLFLHQNTWIKKHLSNAYHSKLKKEHLFILKNNRYLYLLAPVNYLLYVFQLTYMWFKKSTEEVRIGAAFFHKTNYQKIIDKVMSN